MAFVELPLASNNLESHHRFVPGFYCPIIPYFGVENECDLIIAGNLLAVQTQRRQLAYVFIQPGRNLSFSLSLESIRVGALRFWTEARNELRSPRLIAHTTDCSAFSGVAYPTNAYDSLGMVCELTASEAASAVEVP